MDSAEALNVCVCSKCYVRYSSAQGESFFKNFTHSFIPVPNLDFEHIFDVEMGL